MDRRSLYTPEDLQEKLAYSLRQKRKQAKMSREALAQLSSVPAPTIKKFENTGKISLQQFLMLWQSVDSLDPIAAICERQKPVPNTYTAIQKTLSPFN